MPITATPQTARARSGRALVECLVALLLISGASSLVLLLASTTAQVVDQARQRDLVLRESARLRVSLLQAPCLSPVGVWRRDIGPRAVLEANATSAESLHALAVTADWRSSGWGGGSLYTHRTSAAGWCE
jgi:agmatine/peptidylarginine deiminase